LLSSRFAGHRDAEVARRGVIHGDLVEKRHRVIDGRQRVEAVAAARAHLQREIDLRRHPHADAVVGRRDG
jgi:hypothetical protein